MSINFVKPAGMGGFRDHLDHKAGEWISTWDGTSGFDVGLLAAPLSKTSISHSGAFQFPQTVRTALQAYGTYHIDADIELTEHLRAADLGDVQMHPINLSRCHTQIREATASYWRQFPSSMLFLLGGDHSITAPSIQGLASTVDTPIGVIHFDAHHDMRNLEDGGPTNGTPFRTLLTERTIDGSRLIQIGLRNFTNARAYTEYAKTAGATLVTMNQWMRRKIDDVLSEALRIAGRDDALIYVSFDIDVLDQAFVPGVPAPSPGGMTIWDALYAMEKLAQSPQVVAFDWVCADPTVDMRNLTSRVAAQLILHAAAGIAMRERTLRTE